MRKQFLVLMTVILALGNVPAAFAAPGDIDGGFSSSRSIGRAASLSLEGGILPGYPEGSGFNNIVFASAQQTLGENAGKTIVVGAFTEFNHQPVNWIVRLNANGTLDDTFNPGGAGPDRTFVLAVEVDELDRIYIGGSFARYNEHLSPGLARLTPDGAFDETFNVGQGFSEDEFGNSVQFVRSIAVNGAAVVAGGDFTTYAGQNVGKIVRIGFDGTLDADFRAVNGVVGAGFDSPVFALEYDNADLVVGGAFTTLDGDPASRLVKLDAQGIRVTTFDDLVGSRFDGNVLALSVIQSAYIVVGGDFTSRIALLDYDGTVDSTFANGVGTGFSGGTVRTVLLDDSGIYVGGSFTAFKDAASPYFVKLTEDGTLDQDFSSGSTLLDSEVYSVLMADTANQPGSRHLLAFGNFTHAMLPGANGSVYAAVQQADGKYVIGGSFTEFSGQPRNGIARLNQDGSLDMTFDAGSAFNSNQGSVYALALAGTDIVAAGDFQVGDHVGIARLNSDGTVDEDFAVGSGFNGPVYALAMDGANVIAGGNFTAYGSTTGVNSIARLDATGTFVDTYGDGFSGTVRALALDGSALYVGGQFSHYDGTAVGNFTRLLRTGQIDSYFDAGFGFDGPVTAVAANGATVVVAGDFNYYDNVAHPEMIRLNREGLIDDRFRLTDRANGSINAVAIDSSNGYIVVGDFDLIGGSQRGKIARLDSTGTVDESFVPRGFNAQVRSLIVEESYIFAGGDFTDYGGQVAQYVARLQYADMAGFTIKEFGSYGGALHVSESGTNAHFSIVLDSRPLGDVKVGVASSDGAEASVSPAMVTFTTANWSTPQMITVTGNDDHDIDGDKLVTVTASVVDTDSSSDYLNVPDQAVSVIVSDDDIPSLILNHTDGSTVVTEDSTTTDAFAVSLATPPNGNVVVDLVAAEPGLLLSTTSLTFSTLNWSEPQQVVVSTTLTNDYADVARTIGILASVNDALSSAEYRDALDVVHSVNVLDDEVAGVAVVQSEGNTAVTEGGTTDTFTLALTARPRADVVVNVVGEIGQAAPSNDAYTFTTDNWNQPQLVEVTAVDDTRYEGAHIAALVVDVLESESDEAYQETAGQAVRVAITDNDSAPSSGGGGGSIPQPAITLTSPNGNEVLKSGEKKLVLWTYQGQSNHTIRLELSMDNGQTYSEVVPSVAAGQTSYEWTIPDTTALAAKMRVNMLNYGSVVASDASDATFTILGSDTADLPRTGSGTSTAPVYIPSTTINEDKGITAPVSPAPCVSDSLIKTSSSSAVYYCAANGKRYVFPNEKVYRSWYADFSKVTTVTLETMASIQIGGNVTYKPGSRMVKVESDPKTYLVSRGGQLRHVATEAVAVGLFGADWNKKIDDLPVSFFSDYKVIEPISEVTTQ